MRRAASILLLLVSTSCGAKELTQAELSDIVRPCVSANASGLNPMGAASVSGARSPQYAAQATRFAEACKAAREALERREPGHRCVATVQAMESLGWMMAEGFAGRRQAVIEDITSVGRTGSDGPDACAASLDPDLDLPWILGGQ